MRLNRKTILALGALAILLSACGDSNLIGPENQLEATNATDQFQFQLTALANVTDEPDLHLGEHRSPGHHRRQPSDHRWNRGHHDPRR